MTTLAWALATAAATLLLATLGDLISEEIRGWLDLVPHAILRLAATQLSPDQRQTVYQDEWLPELTYALRGAESRPITRLIRGTIYATGLLISARRIAVHINRTNSPQTVSTQAIVTGKLRYGIPRAAEVLKSSMQGATLATAFGMLWLLTAANVGLRAEPGSPGEAQPLIHGDDAVRLPWAQEARRLSHRARS